MQETFLAACDFHWWRPAGCSALVQWSLVAVDHCYTNQPFHMLAWWWFFCWIRASLGPWCSHAGNHASLLVRSHRCWTWIKNCSSKSSPGWYCLATIWDHARLHANSCAACATSAEAWYLKLRAPEQCVATAVLKRGDSAQSLHWRFELHLARMCVPKLVLWVCCGTPGLQAWRQWFASTTLISDSGVEQVMTSWPWSLIFWAA